MNNTKTIKKILYTLLIVVLLMTIGTLSALAFPVGQCVEGDAGSYGARCRKLRTLYPLDMHYDNQLKSNADAAVTPYPYVLLDDKGKYQLVALEKDPDLMPISVKNCTGLYFVEDVAQKDHNVVHEENSGNPGYTENMKLSTAINSFLSYSNFKTVWATKLGIAKEDLTKEKILDAITQTRARCSTLQSIYGADSDIIFTLSAEDARAKYPTQILVNGKLETIYLSDDSSTLSVNTCETYTLNEDGTIPEGTTSAQIRCKLLKDMFGNESDVKFSIIESETCQYSMSLTIDGSVSTVYTSEKPTVNQLLVFIEDGVLNLQGISNDDVSSWNLMFSKVKGIIIGLTGVGALTMVVLFIIQFMKLGASAGNPQERKRALTGVLWTGIAAALLGSVTLVVGFFYNAI
jgi:hypothetical protein